MNKIFLFIFLLSSLILKAQISEIEVKRIDSIKSVIADSKVDSTIVNALKNWDDIIYRIDPNLDYKLNLEIDSICEVNLSKIITDDERLFFNTRKANSLHILGSLDYKKAKYYDALPYFIESVELKEILDDNVGLAKSNFNIGLINRIMGNSSLAIEYVSKALSYYEKVNDINGISHCLLELGSINLEQNELESALDYYNKSLLLSLKENDSVGIGNCYNNMGIVFFRKENYDSATIYFNLSLLHKEDSKDYKRIANSLISLGAVQERIGNMDSAFYYYFKSLKILEDINDIKTLTTLYKNIGTVYYEKGNHQLGITYNEKALGLALETGVKREIRDASNNLWTYYKESNKHKKALEMLELYMNTKDSIEGEQNAKAVLRQKYQYEYEKQAIADSIKEAEAKKVLDAQIQAQTTELKHERTKRFVLYGGVLVLLAFGGFTYNRFQQSQAQKAVIAEQKKEVEEVHKEITDSIAYAKRIQSAILPPDRIVKEYLKESFILYKPKDVVAGDFYWMETVGDKVLFAAADCTGHGVPGAMVSVICNNGLNRSVREYGLTDPGKILDKTREIVIQEFEKSDEEVKDGMDIALCTLEKNKLQYAGAHNPLWIIRNGEVLETKADKQPIGKYAEIQPYTTHSFDLQPEDSLYIFSDGYVDQFGGVKGKKFMGKRLKELLISIQEKSMEDQKTLIDEAFESWRGNEAQVDDVCMIGVRV